MDHTAPMGAVPISSIKTHALIDKITSDAATASIQWEIIEETAEMIQTARHELIRQAAQGQVLHNDDWTYLYRAVDKAGRTVDFFLSRNRDLNAAKTFLRGAMKNARKPTKITLDAYAASHRAVREMKETDELSKRVTRFAVTQYGKGSANRDPDSSLHQSPNSDVNQLDRNWKDRSSVQHSD